MTRHDVRGIGKRCTGQAQWRGSQPAARCMKGRASWIVTEDVIRVEEVRAEEASGVKL